MEVRNRDDERAGHGDRPWGVTADESLCGRGRPRGNRHRQGAAGERLRRHCLRQVPAGRRDLVIRGLLRRAGQPVRAPHLRVRGPAQPLALRQRGGHTTLPGELCRDLRCTGPRPARYRGDLHPAGGRARAGGRLRLVGRLPARREQGGGRSARDIRLCRCRQWGSPSCPTARAAWIIPAFPSPAGVPKEGTSQSSPHSPPEPDRTPRRIIPGGQSRAYGGAMAGRARRCAHSLTRSRCRRTPAFPSPVD